MSSLFNGILYTAIIYKEFQYKLHQFQGSIVCATSIFALSGLLFYKQLNLYEVKHQVCHLLCIYNLSACMYMYIYNKERISVI